MHTAQLEPHADAAPAVAGKPATGAKCRFCDALLETTFVDLGVSPLCESFLRADQLNAMEPFYPLHVWVCSKCFLVQLQEYAKPEDIFTEYAYFSSFSDGWVKHCKDYCDLMTERFGLNGSSQVIEVASNDGYLLQHFVARQIPALGIEPAANIAAVAEAQRGVKTLVRFFGVELARELVAQGMQADLLLGNNVLAQAPDLNDFVGGLKIALKPQGVLTIEVPHLLKLIEHNEFDTIYHEHFSYFSLYTMERIFEAHGLRLFDVDELPTHGGSLRFYACHQEDTTKGLSERVLKVRRDEAEAGLLSTEGYKTFAENVKETKWALLEFLLQVKREGKTIAGYGAPGKGTTMLTYCGIGPDLLEYTVDRNPYKHGRFMPGSRIPIFEPGRIRETKPDYVLILPWNIKDEIIGQLSYIREWGGRFVVPIPRVRVIE